LIRLLLYMSFFVPRYRTKNSPMDFINKRKIHGSATVGKRGGSPQAPSFQWWPLIYFSFRGTWLVEPPTPASFLPSIALFPTRRHWRSGPVGVVRAIGSIRHWLFLPFGIVQRPYPGVLRFVPRREPCRCRIVGTNWIGCWESRFQESTWLIIWCLDIFWACGDVDDSIFLKLYARLIVLMKIIVSPVYWFAKIVLLASFSVSFRIVGRKMYGMFKFPLLVLYLPENVISALQYFSKNDND